MEYRKLPHGNEMISTLGIGTSFTYMMSYDEIVEHFTYAFDKGVNLVDFLCHRQEAFKAMCEAIKPRRKDLFLQSHMGVYYPNDQYTKNRDVEIAKRETENDLKMLDTDYLDVAFISNVDEESDLNEVLKPGGIWDYMLKLKDEGVIHHLGFSSHSVKLCNKLLDMGVFDLFMLSHSPADDFDVEGGKLVLRLDRRELFNRCEKEGVGITTMKTFLGGKLLDEKSSPLGIKLTPYQCIKYNLDRPGILSCVPGPESLSQMKDLLGYYDASNEEKDYSVIGSVHAENMKGSCIYCDHCQPCTAGIEIAMVNKYKDLAQMGDTDALDHYKTLDKHASDCVQCSDCVMRCPFNADPQNMIASAKEYFGY